MNFANHRILVTGGAGFIGSHVTRDLLAYGADVHVVDNLFAGQADLIPDEATFDNVDIRSEDLSAVVTQYNPDTILHLAAIHHVPYCNENPEEAFNVNVMGTRNLLNAAKDVTDLAKVVFTSTAAVYPPRDGANSEAADTGPIDVYGKTKLVGEDLLQLFACDHAANAVAARVFNVYGPNETNPHVIPAILDQVQNGQREIELGNLSPKRDFVHVTDVANALVHLLDASIEDYRVYNVGTGTEHSVRELVNYVSDALGDSVDIVQADDRIRESDRPHLQADITRIEREIGWEPTVELSDGLTQLLAEPS